MYHRQRTIGRLGRAAPHTAKSESRPAWTGGINALTGLFGMAPNECIYCYNLMPSEEGALLRKGYSEWTTSIGGEGTEEEVRTIIPYAGTSEDSANAKLFCATPEGIYDITQSGQTAPTKIVDFSTRPRYAQGKAGFGTWAEYTTDNGVSYLFYADECGGLWRRDPTIGAPESNRWVLMDATYIGLGSSYTGSAAINTDAISYVMVWKERVWFFEYDTGTAWYMPPGAVSAPAGANGCLPFAFGNDFVTGGGLLGLASWTLDGGDGIDDNLVAWGRGGNVAVYQGFDPSSPDGIVRVGLWDIGEFPESKRLAARWGGELYILSSYGIISIRDLLQGVMPADATRSPSAKINRLLRRDILEDMSEPNWSIKLHAPDGILIVVSPFSENTPLEAEQFVQNVQTRAWGAWSGVPINCADTFGEFLYMGDKNGSVWIHDGVLDGTTIDDVGSGEPVEFEGLTSFQAPNGNHSLQHRVGFIRPVGLSSGGVSLNTRAIYDYRTTETLDAPPPPAVSQGAIWDTSLWDAAYWDFSTISESIVQGASGMGRTVAIAVKGSAVSRAAIIAWDMTNTEGGFL